MNQGKRTSSATVTEVVVHILASARCPVCGKRIEIQRKLAEESIITGNTTETAKFHAREMRAQIDAAKARRAWDDARCGRCRDEEKDIATEERT